MKFELRKMKLAYLLIVLFTANWAFAQNFGGVITMNTSNEELKETASVTWYLKGDKSRMDIDSKAGDHNSQYAVIADGKGMDMVAEGHVTAVPQTAMKVDLATQSLVSELDGVSMNGHTCKQVVYTDGVNKTTYWLATGLGVSFDDIPFVIKRNMPKISSQGFPVRMEKRNAEGKVVLSQDVVSVSPTTVDESKFERK